jgi:hypothetical protein
MGKTHAGYRGHGKPFDTFLWLQVWEATGASCCALPLPATAADTVLQSVCTPAEPHERCVQKGVSTPVMLGAVGKQYATATLVVVSCCMVHLLFWSTSSLCQVEAATAAHKTACSDTTCEAMQCHATALELLMNHSRVRRLLAHACGNVF